MKSICITVAITSLLGACGGGKDDSDNATKTGSQSSSSPDVTSATGSCQGGMTASGFLCAAKPHSPGPVLETM